jgi:hypothetical protein
MLCNRGPHHHDPFCLPSASLRVSGFSPGLIPPCFLTLPGRSARPPKNDFTRFFCSS